MSVSRLLVTDRLTKNSAPKKWRREQLVLEMLERRCLPSWTLDDGFGHVVITDFEGEARASVVQQDGKIILAGYTTDQSDYEDFALVRLTSEGELDTTFGEGNDGLVFFDASDDSQDSESESERINAVGIQKDENGDDEWIVVAGTAWHHFDGMSNCHSQQQMTLARFSVEDGSLDTTFGGTPTHCTTRDPGEVTIEIPFDPGSIGRYTVATALGIQDDEKIVVGGWVDFCTNTMCDPLHAAKGVHMAIARLEADGTPDSTYGVSYGDPAFIDGTNYFKIQSDIQDNRKECEIHSLTFINADPDMVVAGQCKDPLGQMQGLDFVLTRFDEDGLPDDAWDGNFTNPDGDTMTVIDFGSDTDDIAWAVMQQTVSMTNYVVAVGETQTGSHARDFAVTRLLYDGSVDTTFGESGDNGLVVLDASGELSDGGMGRAGLIHTGNTIAIGGSNLAMQRSFYGGRLEANGPFEDDTEFTSTFDSGGAQAFAMAEHNETGDHQGKIVVAGFNEPTIGDRHFAAIRLCADPDDTDCSASALPDAPPRPGIHGAVDMRAGLADMPKGSADTSHLPHVPVLKSAPTGLHLSASDTSRPVVPRLSVTSERSARVLHAVFEEAFFSLQ